MIPIKTESAWRGTSDCRNCGIRDMVLFADLNEDDFSMIHAPIDDLEIRAGTELYALGAQALGVFTLRTGMIKLVRVASDGRPRIVRVLRPGDVAGLEALATAHYDSDAVALTDVSVCRIPLAVMHTLKEADDWLADLNFGTARQRVSNLILKMRSPADAQITTLFARDDMGAMLDLKLETVSRAISGLVRERAIEPLDKLGRVYRVLTPATLQASD
jgi:CRP/FNR family transcriptional regulator, anaerobic regulatory protein